MKYIKRFNESLFEYDEQMFKDTFGLSTEELKEFFTDLIDQYPFLDIEITPTITRNIKEISVRLYDNRPVEQLDYNINVSKDFTTELKNHLDDYDLELDLFEYFTIPSIPGVPNNKNPYVYYSWLVSETGPVYLEFTILKNK